jgi:hypothetical protein
VSVVVVVMVGGGWGDTPVDQPMNFPLRRC